MSSEPARRAAVLLRPHVNITILAMMYLLGTRVLRQGKEVRLTRSEYKLLQVLVMHADQVLTHSQLLNQVWGPHAKINRTMSASIWDSCGQKWKPIPPGRAVYGPNRVLDTDS